MNKDNFIKFSEVDPKKPETYEGKRILSMDIDWASDGVLNYVLDILENARVKCCFFVTHQTDVIERIRKNKQFELGLHPNFNPLLANNSTRTADEILTQLKELVPEATVFRSHSLTTSGSFLGLYQKHGATHLSNYMMNMVQDIRPFYHVNGLTEVPIYYADDGDLYLKTNSQLPRLNGEMDPKQYKGIRVYNFHPIHIALNCSVYEDYVESKNEILDDEKMKFYSSTRVGIKNKLLQLINSNHVD